MALNISTPVGRLVQGDLYKKNAAPKQGNQPQKLDANGQPVKSWYVALAIPKNDPAWPAFKATIDAETRAAWPNFFDAAGNLISNTFSNKITDGDAVDKYGKPNATKEGFAGCWVMKVGSQLENGPRVLAWNAQMGAWVESTTVKIGDYASVNFDYATNNASGTNTPGMYANPKMVAFEREGAKIEQQDSGPSAAEAFGARGPSTGAPPPAAGQPVMTAKAGTNTYASMTAAGWTHEALVQHGYVVGNAAPAASPPPPAAGTPPPPIASPTSPPPAPYTGYMDPATTPPPPPVNPPAPVGPVMTAKAGAHTYDAMIAAGWTHDALVQQGYVQP